MKEADFIMVYSKPSTKHRIFTHLNAYQRGQIQVLHQEQRSSREIARKIGPNHRRFQAYFPETGQAIYERNRRHCGRRYKLAAASDFIAYAKKKILSPDKWSPGAITGNNNLMFGNFTIEN